MEELFKPYDLTNAEPIEIAKAIVRILDEKKASNLKLLKVVKILLLKKFH